MITDIVSFSELYKWDTCKRQWYYGFGLSLRAPEVSGPMITGTKGHKLLQAYYTYRQGGFSKEEALQRTKHDAKSMLAREDFTTVGDLLVAWNLVEKYIKETEFQAEIALVENRFLLPVANLISEKRARSLGIGDISIGFTPDVVFKHTGDFYTVEDAKFVGRAWSKSKLDMFPQAKLYQIFLKVMGYNVTRTAIRFFNTKTSELSLYPYKLEPGEEVTLIEDLISAIVELTTVKKQPEHTLKFLRRTNNYNSCQGCQFVFPCKLEKEGKDASKTLKNLYTVNTYDYSV